MLHVETAKIKGLPGAGTKAVLNHAGQRFGRLIAIRLILPKVKRWQWFCRCDCGNEVAVAANDLRKGTLSCGCLQRERTSLAKRVDPEIGQRFDMLTVIGLASSKRRKWLCYCDCGGSVIVESWALRSGNNVSCGCRHQKGSRFVHGDARNGQRSPEYHSWSNMLARCFNKNDIGYDNYGGRGITVCDRWLTYENFLLDMGRKPSTEHSLDRYPDNNGNYELKNCRWATAKEQANNRRPMRPRRRKNHEN